MNKTHHAGYVVKLDGSTGASIWARFFPSSGPGATAQSADIAASDVDQSVVVSGKFQGTITVDGTQHTSSIGTDAFVAKLSAADGSRVWSRALGADYDDVANSLAVDAAGSVYASGHFGSVSAFTGLSPLSVPPLQRSFFVLKVDKDDAPQWLRRFPAPSAMDPDAEYVMLGLLADDSVAVFGTHSHESLQLSGTASIVNPSPGTLQSYLFQLQSDGSVAGGTVLTFQATGGGYMTPSFGPNGNVVVSGRFAGDLPLPGIAAPLVQTGLGDRDIVVASLGRWPK